MSRYIDSYYWNGEIHRHINADWNRLSDWERNSGDKDD